MNFEKKIIKNETNNIAPQNKKSKLENISPNNFS